MNIKEIQDLIKFVAKSGVNEVEIEQKDFKITIRSQENPKEEKQIIVQAAAPAAPIAAAPPAAPAAPAPAPEAYDSKYVTVK